MNKQKLLSSSVEISLIAKIILAFIPIASFFLQYAFSANAGTEKIFFHHSTVMIVDWIFIPFNYWVISIIDWKRGGRLFLIVIIAIVLNVVTHAFWQYNGIDLGHMITNSGVFLPAGWVHLVFSVIESILLFSFVFCRKSVAPKMILVSILAIIYFLAMGISGYLMHHHITLSDAIVTLSGLFFVLVYPRLINTNTKN